MLHQALAPRVGHAYGCDATRLKTIWAIFGTSNFGFMVEKQVCFWYLGIWSLIVLLMLHDPAFIAIPVLTVVQYGGRGTWAVYL